jgi:hypothetical protein
MILRSALSNVFKSLDVALALPYDRMWFKQSDSKTKTRCARENRMTADLKLTIHPGQRNSWAEETSDGKV